MKVLLFNPRSNFYKPRIPNSILQIAAAIEGLYDYVLVDGNLEDDPWQVIASYLSAGDITVAGFTVMPGPQLKQAIPFAKKIRQHFSGVKIVWGGYFPSNQYKTVLDSGYVDYVINGPGDLAFPLLLKAIQENAAVDNIHNLIFLKDQQLVISPKDEIYEQDELPVFPYRKLNSFYPLQKYLGRTYLGSKTIAYHSSFGCPFTCSFCAVVPIYNARWKGKSASKIYEDIIFLKENYGGNAIEFHDNNFFVSEKRTIEFSTLMLKEQMNWWGEGRIDTIHKYSDESLDLMSRAGCRMIFFGAETGSDAVLKRMDKGGTQTGTQIKAFAERLRKFGIIPEYSFVLGLPGDNPEAVMKQIDDDIDFIRQIKEINPDTEIIIYVYSPVPTEGSEMYKEVIKSGFRFPQHLDDWLNPEWENFDLRKNPLTPWLTKEMIDKIKNFETVLNGFFPTVSDIKLKPIQKRWMRRLSSLRYHNKLYRFPIEIKALQKFWLRYRQPETEGF